MPDSIARNGRHDIDCITSIERIQLTAVAAERAEEGEVAVAAAVSQRQMRSAEDEFAEKKSASRRLLPVSVSVVRENDCVTPSYRKRIDVANQTILGV